MAHNKKQGGGIIYEGYKALELLMMNQGKANHQEQLEQHILKQYQWLSERQEARLEQSQQPRKPFSQWIAQHRKNDQQNRYMNIIPFDWNRVVLERQDLGPWGHPGDDYINASWIEFVKKDTQATRKRYIATQGPLPSTCGDFWRMVLEQKVKVIVCLTPEVESGRAKCAAYWPEGLKDTKRFEMIQQQQSNGLLDHFLSSKNNNNTTSISDGLSGRWIIKVKNTQEEQVDRASDCILRQIQVTCYYQRSGSMEMEQRARSIVYQLQYLGWSDHGVPQETSTLLSLIRLANELQPTQDDSPMVVHCSAGCGRTGTFCVVDTGIEWLGKLKNDNVSQDSSGDNRLVDPIFEMTDAFRKQRTTMVQTPTQYMFCYLAIWDGLKQL